MSSILNTIVAYKKDYVAQQKIDIPLDTFQGDITKSDRDFYQAFYNKKSANEMAFILECKKASPSKGLIRAHFDVSEIARTYAPYATATSVLTDEKIFQGSFDFLPLAKSATHTPILCKDFFIDPYQVYYARHRGANAILLMLSVVDDATYRELSTIAHDLGMGVLTEVINESEAQRAIDLGAKIIGINNRNLHDLSTDITRTRVLRKHLPNDVIVISESGIYTFADTMTLRPDCDGFLVGSSLMAQDDIDRACRSLVMGKNKICGLTKPEHAQSAYENGAVYGGLIFAKKSKRYVDTEIAKSIIQSAPLQYIGVFVDEDNNTIIQMVNDLKLSGVQLHGNETDTDIDILKKACPSITVIKAIGVDMNATAFDIPVQNADYYVIDTAVDGQSGGTGLSFNWNSIPDSLRDKCLLSGGIGVDEIPHAIEQKCMGLDMNSKLENPPPTKDTKLIEQALTAILKKG